MTRIIACLLVGVMLAVSSCSDKNKVPAGVLPHEKMEAVMWDVIQSEQYSAAYLAKDSAHINLKMENLRLYDEVFRLHEVSREEFRKSYLYYMGRADLAQVLFDSLLSKGNRLRTESYSRSYRPVTTTPPFGVSRSSPGETARNSDHGAGKVSCYTFLCPCKSSHSQGLCSSQASRAFTAWKKGGFGKYASKESFLVVFLSI